MWLCKPCDFENDDLTVSCKICNSDSPLSHYYRDLVAIKRGVFLEWGYMTPQEELYAEFFNRGKLFVKDMDITQLREHRDKLSRIAFEAKATLASAEEELRERKAKTSPKVKDWTITPNDTNLTSGVHTDAINAVKIRKERMSSIDRMRSKLLSAGIDEETVNEMIKGLERNATEKSLKTVKLGSIQPVVVPTAQVKEPELVPETVTEAKPNPFAQFAKK